MTVAEIGDALARFERNLGWERPTLHGVGFAEGTDEISFVRVNDREHLLAAAVLATVTGWRGTTGSVRLGKNKLAKRDQTPRAGRGMPGGRTAEPADLARDPSLVMGPRLCPRRPTDRSLRRRPGCAN